MLKLRLTRRVRQALEFATRAHGAQRYGAFPYSFHLRGVMVACDALGFRSERDLIIAALHDVQEDTATLPRTIEEKYGPDIRRAVGELSRPIEGTDDPAAKRAYFDAMGDDAFRVKLADRLSNLRLHGREGPEYTDKQLKRTLPKYAEEQLYLAQRAAKDPKQFGKAIRVVQRELEDAARRLGVALDQPEPG